MEIKKPEIPLKYRYKSNEQNTILRSPSSGFHLYQKLKELLLKFAKKAEPPEEFIAKKRNCSISPKIPIKAESGKKTVFKRIAIHNVYPPFGFPINVLDFEDLNNKMDEERVIFIGPLTEKGEE